MFLIRAERRLFQGRIGRRIFGLEGRLRDIELGLLDFALFGYFD
jgi:hypothetical protein